jgi:hypothetical protein
MKEAVFIGAVAGVVASLAFGFFTMIKASSNQWERNEQTFKAECAAVNGRAVWNNKYWECLK